MMQHLILVCGILMCSSSASSNYDTSMVHRLMTDRDILIEDGLSYFNGTTLTDVQRSNDGHEVRCIISVENWSKWMLCHGKCNSEIAISSKNQPWNHQLNTSEFGSKWNLDKDASIFEQNGLKRRRMLKLLLFHS